MSVLQLLIVTAVLAFIAGFGISMLIASFIIESLKVELICRELVLADLLDQQVDEKRRSEKIFDDYFATTDVTGSSCNCLPLLGEAHLRSCPAYVKPGPSDEAKLALVPPAFEFECD